MNLTYLQITSSNGWVYIDFLLSHPKEDSTCIIYSHYTTKYYTNHDNEESFINFTCMQTLRIREETQVVICAASRRAACDMYNVTSTFEEVHMLAK